MGVEPARHKVTTRQLGQTPARDVSVTVHRYCGGDGPTVYVQAAQHGIELNGPAALRRLHDRLCDMKLAGTVIVVPVMNPLAFDTRSYATPDEYDSQYPNVNRVWPGADDGSFQQRIVAELWPLAVDADAAIDLHTGTPSMLEHVRVVENDDEATALATAFGTNYRLIGDGPISNESTGEGSPKLANEDNTSDADDNIHTTQNGESGGYPQSVETFRVAMTRANVPTITVELGNSRTIDRSVAERGAIGVCRVLEHRGMLTASGVLADQLPEPPTQRQLNDDIPVSVTPASGLFEPAANCTVGSEVTDGQRLGVVYDPTTFKEQATITAPESGVIYSLSHGGTVFAGERVASVATPVESTTSIDT
ncbi:succinylglutamate desuccinylase/aspartoacylase family protein [Haloquadratum walsbyi]|uniref:Putative deacylase n=1 Tax=Haloquadratum walsbyi J07HQW2 TaxID=1238425 RepID=U1PWK4_9EURY|nr:succinylglutamate desuccinylase/aspartoacylase family protein [Haloquadratum walsbyi]ERG96816.1 MAG: putative deacylase [Haloquadratum walsbyi J07HQW2]